ncbi:flagellar filament capping protein FliD [Xanthomonas sp. GPE 39]|uniref:flagellar filament capping protein FliD n=1 Tax=Xanthomonas sp. GPE 39 TaxID=1583099 RepID=UPI0005F28398|nr:flagellar filament capping protein FliD [Xanthomonas sp. GPE 39]
MAATSSIMSSIGSGLDIPTFVANLVAQERAPQQDRINKDGTASTAQLSALGTIKGAMSNLQTAINSVSTSADTPAFTASVDAGAGYTASVTSNATAGNYNVEVVSLAQAQKLTSAAYASTATVGNGTLTIAYGTSSLNVTIAPGSTLSDIAAAINKAAGGNGVTASVVNADDGNHLVLNAVNTGTKGALTVTASGGDGGLAAFAYPSSSNSSGSSSASGMTQNTAATDAVVRVDGFTRTSSSNSIADLVPGAVLNLTKATPGSTFKLSIANDNSGLKANLTALVSAYNATNTVLNSSSDYNATTKTASPLTGDAMVRGLQGSLRKQVSDNIVALGALGVSIDKDGVMSFDSGKFDSAMASNPASAKSMFGANGSFSSGMNTLLNGNLDGTNGTLTQRTNALNKHISDLTDQLSDLDQRMSALSDQYTARFSAMNTLVAQMQSIQDSLSKQFG